MAILLSMVTPRKSKGLAMAVVPKVIEGMNAKYVTGSGQTKSTADRVHIFETEGGVTASSRGGRSKGKKNKKCGHRGIKKGKKKTPLPIKIGRENLKSYYYHDNDNEKDNDNDDIQKNQHHSLDIMSSYSISSLPDLLEEHDKITPSKLPNIVSKESFVTGYIDDDFTECLTILRTRSRSGGAMKEKESNSFVEINSDSDRDNRTSLSPSTQGISIRRHPSLSKLFNWGSSAFLLEAALGDNQQRASHPVGNSASTEDLLMPHYVLKDPNFDIFAGYV